MSTCHKSRVRYSARIRGRAADERGATLVLVTLFLPVLILVASLAIDVGNWFEHKRHLQMQADSAALAAALDLRSPCSDATVDNTAASYGGGDYNAQVQDRQADVHMVINSRTYYNQTSPVDSTVNTHPPCTADQVDVKLTETDLPWYFRVASVPFINAHARVSLFAADQFAGSLPLAVPDVEPKKVAVQFIDESTHTVIATKQLTNTGTSNGLSIWDNVAAPQTITVDKADIGTRVIVSGSDSITCGDPLVSCYDGNSNNGLSHIRGWTAAGSGAQPNQPIARSVTLEPGTCADAYFSSSSSTCTIGVRARVDAGSLPTAQLKLTAAVNGTNYPLSFDSTSGTWSTGLTVSVPSVAGALPVTLNWEEQTGTVGTSTCNNHNNNPCKGSFGTVQRTYSANDTGSGPIKSVVVSEGAVPDTNSIQRCSAVLTTCDHSFAVTVGLQGSLGVASSVNDPIVTLRFSGGGSQSQGLDCDPNISQFQDEIAFGCTPSYEPNQGTACPGNASALWATPNPWQCVANQTGQYVNKIPEGLNHRILCPPTDPASAACNKPEKPTSCTHPNNWSMFASGLPADDTRIVQLFVTNYGAFSSSGSVTVPIIRFATFYVTGWGGSGAGFPNPCQGQGDDPAADGTIVGHFIHYVDTLDTSNGTTVCDPLGLIPCVPVLTQ
jgi:Flp pilus assembly protein TadG